MTGSGPREESRAGGEGGVASVGSVCLLKKRREVQVV